MEPRPPVLVQCVWCKRDVEKRLSAVLPGTRVVLCPKCLVRYMGFTEGESSDGHTEHEPGRGAGE